MRYESTADVSIARSDRFGRTAGTEDKARIEANCATGYGQAEQDGRLYDPREHRHARVHARLPVHAHHLPHHRRPLLHVARDSDGCFELLARGLQLLAVLDHARGIAHGADSELEGKKEHAPGEGSAADDPEPGRWMVVWSTSRDQRMRPATSVPT